MAWTERYVTVTGAGANDGTSEANAWTLAQAIAAPYAAGQRINVKAGGAGTPHDQAANNRSFSVSGTTTAPIWWRGYKTTPGDMDGLVGNHAVNTDIPEILFSTGQVTIGGNFQIFSNISFLGTANASRLVDASGTFLQFDRCRFENRGTNANSRAMTVSTADGKMFSRCWFKAGSSATQIMDIASAQTMLQFCSFHGGGHGITTASGTTINGCIFNALAGDCIRITGNAYYIISNCSFYDPTGDGIEITSTSTTSHTRAIINNVFDSCAVGINNTSGGNLHTTFRGGNLFFLNGGTAESGFGDSPTFADPTADSASPFTAGGSADFSLKSTSNGKAGGMVGMFENQSYTSFLDCGAVQREEPTPGGGGGAGPLIGTGRLIRN